jgi:hypothetical protein
MQSSELTHAASDTLEKGGNTMNKILVQQDELARPQHCRGS